MAQNESEVIAERWRLGVRLSEAWFAFGDERSIGLFRTAQQRGGVEARLLLMVVDLWADLSNGLLLATGHRVSPTISNGPVLIPADMFFDRPPPDVGESDDIEISGWRYERVRICKLNPPSVDDGLDEQVPPAASEPEKATSASKHGGGRPSMYKKAIIVLEELFEVAANVTLPSDRLHPAFVAEFVRRFPISDYGNPPPSSRSLRSYLARYRQELAKTGNNKDAG